MVIKHPSSSEYAQKLAAAGADLKSADFSKGFIIMPRQHNVILLPKFYGFNTYHRFALKSIDCR